MEENDRLKPSLPQQNKNPEHSVKDPINANRCVFRFEVDATRFSWPLVPSVVASRP
jgi:hypothetical protein